MFTFIYFKKEKQVCANSNSNDQLCHRKQQQKEDAAHRSQHPLQVVNQTTNEQAHVACGSDTLVAVTSASNELNLNPMIGIAAPGTFNVKNQNVEEEDDDDDDEDE